MPPLRRCASSPLRTFGRREGAAVLVQSTSQSAGWAKPLASGRPDDKAARATLRGPRGGTARKADATPCCARCHCPSTESRRGISAARFCPHSRAGSATSSQSACCHKSAELRSGSRGCLPDDVGATAGVLQRADDWVPRPSRQSRAKSGPRQLAGGWAYEDGTAISAEAPAGARSSLCSPNRLRCPSW